MADQAVHPSSAGSDDQRGTRRWRTVDIVVTAVLGVAFGVVFWAWGLLWAAAGAPFAAFPPGQAVMYGVWLLPAVLAPLIVRKAGAGLFAEFLAAVVSALLGSAWGAQVLIYGLLGHVLLQTPCAGMTRIRFEGLRLPALSAPKRSPAACVLLCRGA